MGFGDLGQPGALAREYYYVWPYRIDCASRILRLDVDNLQLDIAGNDFTDDLPEKARHIQSENSCSHDEPAPALALIETMLTAPCLERNGSQRERGAAQKNSIGRSNR